MAAPVQRDQELELTVESLAYGGNGVARLDGFVVFVRRGLPGDTVRARVTKVHRRHAEALAAEVLVAGPNHVVASCAHYPTCGGCRFQDLAYDAQVAAKEQWVADSLQRLAGLSDPPRGLAVPLPKQDGVLVRRHPGRCGSRAPQGRTVGRGPPDRPLLAHDRRGERDPEP